MGHVSLDHPGDWHWFHGYGPVPVIGPCPHENCLHNAMTTIAYGPDYDHYELVVCMTDDGCNGRCRGWSAEYPPHIAKERGSPCVLFPDQNLGWLEVITDG